MTCKVLKVEDKAKAYVEGLVGRGLIVELFSQGVYAKIISFRY